MLRKIIHIDEDKCTGCGLCVDACHEGAIAMVDGKARLVRDDYCDGLGDCLPSCPTDAISFVEREAAPYDEAAVAAHLATRNNNGMSGSAPAAPHGGCPGSRSRSLDGAPAPAASAPATRTAAPAADNADPLATIAAALPNRLAQWPCQIKLVPVNAPYFQGAKLLIAADCTAYAYANMHSEFMNGKITLIGCPKLDAVDYTDKLTEIIRGNDIQSVTIVRMEVPCCGGLEHAAREALRASGKFLPWQVVTISIDGKILDR